MKILALDTSGKRLGMALCSDDKVLAERGLELGFTHSETMMPQLIGMLKDASLELKDLDILAAAAGPGSFTGLRIGLAALKALAWLRQIPLYALSTLVAMGEPYQALQQPLIAALDARGGRVYSSLRRGEEELLPEGNRQAAELLEQLQETLPGDERILLLGDGGSAILKAAEAFPPVESRLIPLELSAAALRPQSLARLALAAWQRGERPGWQDAHALYLSPSQAERLHGK